MTKEQEMENRRKIHEILDIVLDTNGMYSRKRGVTGTLPTVFMSFSGHVSELAIDVHPDGWGYDPYGKVSYKKTFDIYIDNPINDDFVNNLRDYCQHSLSEKREAEFLQMDIIEQEETIKSMKQQLRKTIAKEKRSEV